MKKVVSLISALVLVAMVISIIRARPDGSTVVPVTATSTVTTDSPSTDTSGVPSDLAPSTTAEITDGTTAHVSTPSTGVATFAITEAIFGDDGYVAVTNVGGATGNLRGYVIYQHPDRFVLPSIEVEPFETIWVAVFDGAGLTNTAVRVVRANGSMGTFGVASGELALYRTANFLDPAEILSYVEWGESGHVSSPVAVQAGLWTEDAFVAIPSDSFGVQATTSEPSSPDEWVAWIGG